jgi:ankyrin repeat protein
MLQEFAAAVLLEARASVNATDLNRETALHLAAGNGAAEIMKLLVKEGASLTATNIAGN